MINTELKKHPIKDEIGDSELKMLFRMFDVDSSGFITASEYKMCLIALGEEATEEEIDETMREADKNGDGKISFEEFSKMMEDSDSDSDWFWNILKQIVNVRIEIPSLEIIFQTHGLRFLIL